jgi:hypothetical protein
MKRSRFPLGDPVDFSEGKMRISLKILVLLTIFLLFGMSCQLVSGLADDSPLSPTSEFIFQESGALVFDPEQLPEAQVEKEYEATISVSESDTPVGEFILQDGELPPGLEIIKVEDEENRAVIKGIPTQAGVYKFTLYVWCYGTQKSGQTAEKEYTIVVQ